MEQTLDNAVDIARKEGIADNISQLIVSRVTEFVQ
jgi:hypothetical protein